MGTATDRGPIDVALLERTIGADLEATVSRFGDREALVDSEQGVRQTYAELDAAVDLLARGLLAAGITTGDRVGIWSPNRAEWVHVQFATARIGAILVNVNPAYRTSELAYALHQSGCRLLVAAPAHLTSDYRAMVAEVEGDLPELERTVFLGSSAWDDLIAGGHAVAEDDLRALSASLDPDDPINIQYTSGTTGFPKGATLSHRNILNNAYFVGNALRLTEQDRLCVPVPLYHCFGMVMGVLGCTTRGATIVLPGAAFDAERVLRTVAGERCTALYGVPTMFIAELARPEVGELDLSSLRTGIMAGSPCPVEVMKRVIADLHMDEVTIAYGMTETSPVSTQTAVDDSIHHRTETVGRVHPHVEIRIADPETGRTVDHGETGELCTRGYSVMLGYWDDPERTAEAVDGDGWMHTGDLATMDPDGYVSIVGRSKDMVIRGGENVYPREVEEFLYTHPDVEDVQVVGVPDERYGEELMAWVKPRPGAAPDAESIREFCRGRIAHYKIPRYVRLVEEFPMTVTGKVQKFRLREMAAGEMAAGETTAGETTAGEPGS